MSSRKDKKHRKRQRNNKEVITFGRHWRGQMFPPRLRVVSDYTMVKQQSNNGQSYYNSRLIPTFLYDIDPALGSTAMPYFTELAGIYRRYRLVKCSVQFKFANRETFPVLVYVVPNNTDPGNNVATGQDAFYSNPRAKKMVVPGSAGNNVGKLGLTFTVAEFAGSVNVNLDDVYSARMDGTGGSPVQALTVVFGVISTGADLLTTTGGLTMSLDLKLEWDAFEILLPAT